MTEDEELLVERVVSAHRARGAQGEVSSHPAWNDLGPEGRARAYEATVASRKLEASLDPQGRSSTVRAVLARLTRRR